MSNPINLSADDLAFLFDAVTTPGEIRNVSGYGNNVANPLWGNSDQPFVRLGAANYAGINSPTGVMVDADGRPVDAVPGGTIQYIQTLPNERLISDVLSEQIQPPDADGNPSDSMPNPVGANLNLMLFGQFFDHGLDFLKRGGETYTVNLAQLPSDIAATDVILDNLPPGFPPALFQGRGARFTDNGDGTFTFDNTDGTLHINKTSPFVDQNQTYGSTDGVSYLLRESILDGSGNVVGKTFRLLDGPSDAEGHATLARYQDVLTNNGVSQADIATALNMAATGSDYNAWLYLIGRPGFVDFGDIGDPNHTPILGDKNDFFASPVDQNGAPNPSFSLASLLGYYIAGDHRANENVGLTAIHTIWHREHNFQAEKIAASHPEWTADQVFQAAKIIVEAEYQRVVFAEFSPAMSGDVSHDHGFSGYDPNVNAGISEEFASAVYRVGHSMINEKLSYVDSTGERHDFSLIDGFLNPELFASNVGGQDSAAALLLGGTQVAHQQIDELLVNAVRNMLLGQPLDLGALNIARGRDVGLPSLNEMRAIIQNGTLLEQAGQASDYRTTTAAEEGLTVAAYTGWSDFGANLRDPAVLVDFIALYGIDPTLQAAITYADKLAAATVLMSNAAFMSSTETGLNDVDLWIGGLAERRVGGSQMGATFTWVFQEQLDRLQDGDRLYYVERLDGTTLLQEIEAQKFSDIIARNTGLEHLHDDIFAVAHEVSLTDDGNTDGNADTANFSGVSAASVAADKLIVVGNDNANSITGSVGDDTIYGEGGDDVVAGGAGDDGLKGGDGADNLDGGSGEDRLFGDAGNDTLSGGQNKDKLLGGDGNDVLSGGSDDDALFGEGGDDRLIGGSGKDHLDGGDGIDTADYSGSASGVTVVLDFSVEGTGGDAARDKLANIENVIGSGFVDRITGDGGANVLQGMAGNDILNGGGGDDTLDGGTGADTMSGSTGNDTYVVDSSADVVTESFGGGTDTVKSSITYTAGANIENVTLLGTANINATGNTLANVLTGNGGNNVLSGLGGSDTLIGYAGIDTLDGGTGADTMIGGNGNDTYIVDNAGDAVSETVGGGLGGVDTVKSSISYVAGTNVENVTLTGSSNINATGNALNNVLTGNSGNNILAGLGGSDTYHVQNAGDLVDEGAGGGTDSVYSTVDYALAAGSQVEKLFAESAVGLALTGNELANTIYGGAGADTLNGGGGNDILDGKAGADVMAGGTGNDGYYVDNVGDVVNEGAGGGTDSVKASVDYTLEAGSQVERLYANDDGGLTLTGNELANNIYGAAGDDTLKGEGGSDILDGRAGADTMIGGQGNDRYYIDNAGDVVTESAGGGTDAVFTGVSYTLSAGSDIESLYASAVGITVTGNELANKIYGAAGSENLNGGGGNDVLDGKAGADVMAGDAGNDTYYVDAAGDVVNEAAGGGTDRIYASVNYTLGAGSEVEQLLAKSNGGLTLTGNEGVNRLYGAAGADVLDGASGHDYLRGGAGNDTFVFRHVADTGASIGLADRIEDFSAGDHIDLTGMEADSGVSFDFVGTAAFSHQAGEMRQFASGINTVVSGDINGDAVGDFTIVVMGNHTLQNSDFLL